MKRLVGFTGAVLMICLAVGVFFAPPSSAESTIATKSEIVATSAAEVFIIKVEDNRIVVYKKGGSEPYLVTDTSVSSLPKGDVVYLENGIEIEGKDALRKALQDYCS